MTKRELARRLAALRAVVVGGLNIDRTLVADEVPPDDGCAAVKARHITFGGHAGNAATALTRLGLGEVCVLGAVGSDAEGDALVQDLSMQGVSTRLVQRIASLPTGEVVIPCFQSMRYMLLHRGANDGLCLAPGDAAMRALSEADLVLVFDPPRAVLSALRGFERKGFWVWNPGGLYPRQSDFWALTAGVSAVVLNRTEMALARRHLPAGENLSVRALTLIETRGVDGGVLCAGDSELKFSAVRVDTVDETGAGDAFTAAFAAMRAASMAHDECLSWAAIVAALSTTQAGARAGLPTLEQAAALREQRDSRLGAQHVL